MKFCPDAFQIPTFQFEILVRRQFGGPLFDSARHSAEVGQQRWQSSVIEKRALAGKL